MPPITRRRVEVAATPHGTPAAGPGDAEHTARRGLVLGGLVYMMVVTGLFKSVRAHWMSVDASSARPWLALPFSFGADLLVIAVLGLGLYGLARSIGSRARWILGGSVLSLYGFWLAMSLMGYHLVGAPPTWQTLRGAEGGTLADLDLLDAADVRAGVLWAGGALALVPAALWLGRRWRRMHGLASPRGLVALALVAALVMIGQRLGPRTFGLEEAPVAVLGMSMLDDLLVRPSGLALNEPEWARLHTPLFPDLRSDDLPALGDRRPRNVIVFVAEGTPFGLTPFGLEGLQTTPHLWDRARRHGLSFTRYYANWHSSIQALYAIACSDYPTTDVEYRTIVTLNPRIDCGELSEVMRAHGRRAGLFHGGLFRFYDKLAFFGGRGYEVTLDAESLSHAHPRWHSHRWGIDDRAVVDGALQWIDSLPKDEAFAALLIPVTGHYPYWVPDDFEPPFEGDDERARFLNAVAFQDAVFERLARGLERRGLYDDTLLVWLADHGTAIDRSPKATPGKRTFYQRNLHVPLVLLHPGLFPEDQKNTEPRATARLGSHVDLLPTVVDALGLPPDPRHRGQSLLSPAYEPRRVFFGAFAGRDTFVGLVEGDRKTILALEDGRMEHYDLRADPNETHDLSDRFGRHMRIHERDLRLFHEGTLGRLPSHPTLPDEPGVHAAVLRQASVAWDGPDGRVSCGLAPDGSSRACPGMEGVFLTEIPRKVGRQRSRCLELRLPPGTQEAEVGVAGRILDRISGARFGVPRRTPNAGAIAAEVVVDGDVTGTQRIGPEAPLLRVTFPRPERSVRFRFSPERDDAPHSLCLVLSDGAWRNTPATRARATPGG